MLEWQWRLRAQYVRSSGINAAVHLGRGTTHLAEATYRRLSLIPLVDCRRVSVKQLTRVKSFLIPDVAMRYDLKYPVRGLR